ncbi:hypothetical protein, partial [Pseudomonas aeruginosa]|uniref:hypothetical protein n=1 Tax=Pseudomonas aeruginosa TaxID=287 RepID=UPI001C71FA08
MLEQSVRVLGISEDFVWVIKLCINPTKPWRIERWRRQKLSATPDLSGTVLPLCLIPNSALKSAPPFKSVVPKASA